MTIEEDISDFADKGDFLETLNKAQEIYYSPPEVMKRELSERSAMYLEFMAAAFIKETGIPASECELVCEQLPSINGFKIIWYFKKREIHPR